jgi:hypothetical protein
LVLLASGEPVGAHFCDLIELACADSISGKTPTITRWDLGSKADGDNDSDKDSMPTDPLVSEEQSVV